MAEESNAHKEYVPPPVYDLNAKWDACLDLTLRRGVYYSFAGAFGGLLLFRSPAARWAAIAFGAGAGLGSAYSECSYKFAKDGGLPVPHVSNASKRDPLLLSNFYHLLHLGPWPSWCYKAQSLHIYQLGIGGVGVEHQDGDTQWVVGEEIQLVCFESRHC
nr:MICOS complex subunit Mic10-like [Ipomoea batatas]GME14315.1 MICOS complex subunit Mic10-like [Ipomoea batatas]